MITPSLLVIYQYSLNTDRLFFFPSAMGKTNNDLPKGILAALKICVNLELLSTLPLPPLIFMTDQKALCQVMLRLLLRNK